MVSTTDEVAPVLAEENPCSQSEETIQAKKFEEVVSPVDNEEESDCEVMQVENGKNGHCETQGNGLHSDEKEEEHDENGKVNGSQIAEDHVECIELDDDEDTGTREPVPKKVKLEEEEAEVKKEDKKSELNSPEALLDKLDDYVQDAINNNKNVDRKILDALLGAINVQVQKEPLSVRKLILDKKLVLPNTISFPPSSIVDMLIEHDPEFPLSKVITKMFGEERPKPSEVEKKEKQQLKANNPAPHMTKLLLDIGQDLVQEATYCDIVHARNLPEMPKNIETYKTVAAQLRPVWEALKKKNEVYKLPILNCQVCGFQTESRLILQNHRSKSHFTAGKYQCAMCPEYDTNEQRLINHYLESHLVVATKDEQQAKYPCLICEEDFQFKGLRDQHMKMCKKEYSKIRYVMGPKGQDDFLTINRWLWERPPIDPTILQQQQAAQVQQKKTNHLANSQAQVQRGIANRNAINNAALLQQQLLRSQQQQQLQRQLGSLINKNMQQAGNNALIAAMQQHLQKQATGKTSQANTTSLAAAVAAANKGNLTMGLNQRAIIAAQQQLAQQALKRAAPGSINPTAARQIMSMMSGGGNANSNSTASSASSPSLQSQITCEVCDSQVQDKEKYLSHLQGNHKQMCGKTVSDMNQGAPLACSRCRDRFWTYEGLERHLVMSHGLVTADLLQKAQKKEDGGRCKLCSKQYAFNILQHLVADHCIKLCSAEILYSCDVCAFKCSSYHLLETHLSTMHPKNGEKDAKSDNEKISKLRAVDNLFAVLYEFAVEGLDTFSGEEALDLIRKEVVKVNWADAVDCWQSAKERRHISGGVSQIKIMMKAFVENGTVQSVTESSPSFRVTCKRGGAKTAHNFSSMDAARIFGAQLNNIFGWRPDMKHFDMEVILNIMMDKMLVMIALNEESLYKRNVVAFGPTTLRSSICYSMVALAAPKPGDKLLDPLCGGGSIPIEGALAFSATHWTGVDNHEKALERCTENYNQNAEHFGSSTVKFTKMDATCLSFATDSFNAIVTDMPFGKKIGSIVDNRILYPHFLKEWERVVIPGGKAVILTKDKRTIENVLKSRSTMWQMTSGTTVNVGGLEVLCSVLINKK